MVFNKRTFRRNKKAPRRFRKSKMPFSKTQTRTIKALVNKSVNKTREMKNRPYVIDDEQITLGGSSVLECTNTQPNTYVLNFMPNGTTNQQRIGTQCTPQRFVMKGWAKILSSPDDNYFASQEQVYVRTVMGYVDNNTLQQMEASISNVPWFWNGTEQISTSTYKDIIRNLNYSVIRPVYDKTKSIAPTAYMNNTSGAQEGLTPQMKDHFRISINHKFPKNMELTVDADEGDCWQRHNLVCLVFSRTMNDKSANGPNIHFFLEGQLYYTDA